MGVIHCAAVMVLLVLICPLEGETTNGHADGPESDAQNARATFALLASAESNHDGADTDEHGLNANSLMDEAIEHFVQTCRDQNTERIQIPSFQEGFSKKVGLIKVKGSFKGENGWLDGITSITRKDNARMRLEGATVLFEASLQLDEIRLGMDYNAKLTQVSVTGKLEAKVRDNTLACSGGLTFSSGKCRLFLKDLKIQQLGKVDIHVTGLGLLNGLSSKIVTWVTARLHNDIKKAVEANMRNIIENEMDDLECLPELIPLLDSDPNTI